MKVINKEVVQRVIDIYNSIYEEYVTLKVKDPVNYTIPDIMTADDYMFAVRRSWVNPDIMVGKTSADGEIVWTANITDVSSGEVELFCIREDEIVAPKKVMDASKIVLSRAHAIYQSVATKSNKEVGSEGSYSNGRYYAHREGNERVVGKHGCRIYAIIVGNSVKVVNGIGSEFIMATRDWLDQ